MFIVHMAKELTHGRKVSERKNLKHGEPTNH